MSFAIERPRLRPTVSYNWGSTTRWRIALGPTITRFKASRTHELRMERWPVGFNLEITVNIFFLTSFDQALEIPNQSGVHAIIMDGFALTKRRTLQRSSLKAAVTRLWRPPRNSHLKRSFDVSWIYWESVHLLCLQHVHLRLVNCSANVQGLCLHSHGSASLEFAKTNFGSISTGRTLLPFKLLGLRGYLLGVNSKKDAMQMKFQVNNSKSFWHYKQWLFSTQMGRRKPPTRFLTLKMLFSTPPRSSQEIPNSFANAFSR